MMAWKANRIHLICHNFAQRFIKLSKSVAMILLGNADDFAPLCSGLGFAL